MKWLIISLIFLSACCPTRLLNTSTTDSIRVEIKERIVRDTVTVYLEVPVEIERQTVLTDSSHLETSFAVSDAVINEDGSLYHSLENKPQKRSVEVKTEVVVRDSLVFRDREVEKVVQVERQLTKWQNFRLQGFWVLLSIVLLFVGLKLIPIVKKFI
jgi:hypothetical protein